MKCSGILTKFAVMFSGFNFRWLTLILLVSMSLFFAGCKTREKLVYFQNGSSDTITQSNYTPVFKTDDYLSIIVTGEELETVAPFNLHSIGFAQTTNSSYTNGAPAGTGYLIDELGEVNMPFIGKVKLVDLNRMEATELIQSKLSDYLKNPIVHIQILNYKITVLGDVKVPGTFKIPNERITLVEAIGLAGDLNITGNRKNVLVIRDENGIKTEFRVDLTSKDFLSSPAYYLSQNDVIYVEPNRVARSNSTLWRTSGSIFISTAALIITTIGVILK